MEIHQILPTLSPGDAIGNEVVLIRDVLKSWGYKSEIFAINVHQSMKALYYLEHKKISSEKNILIYHLAIGSDISKYVMSVPDRKILLYHNITPPHFFYNINDNLAMVLQNGRNELKLLADKIDIALGDSEYNRLELEKMGYPETGVLPLIIDFSKYDRPNTKIISEYDDGWTNILFVGRIAPNKKQEDVIKCFYYYKAINPNSRLFLVGGFNGSEVYYNYLQDLIDHLKIKDIHLVGKVDFADLISYYKLADIFLCMSEHEGFCVPLIESMHFGVPIIAYNSTAIPYTMNGTSILVNKKCYPEIAEMINLVLTDKNLRDRIIKKQTLRLKNFDYQNGLTLFKEQLNKVIHKW
ncbi:MAG: glycosyltransferase [Methanomethylovorans sp.]|uniref:glycosyltransferase n=1 Tax=Methanomethylovorans sp. TaxID=2758717 RepID=UPI000A5F0B62|nr:glycosyltransferase [Methanomethylovorans sp.]